MKMLIIMLSLVGLTCVSCATNQAEYTEGPQTTSSPVKKAIKKTSALARSIRIVKNEPSNCRYVADYAYSFQYWSIKEEVLDHLRQTTADAGGNYFVLDVAQMEGSTGVLAVLGRVFACPKTK